MSKRSHKIHPLSENVKAQYYIVALQDDNKSEHKLTICIDTQTQCTILYTGQI
jgi:hypothetical protein